MKPLLISHPGHRFITLLICLLAIITVGCEGPSAPATIPNSLPAELETVESIVPNASPAEAEPAASPEAPKGITSGVQSCVRDEKDEFTNDFPKGWKSFHCVRWTKAHKNWIDNYYGKLSTFQYWEKKPYNGNPMQLGPYQEGAGYHYVVTDSGVQYPVALSSDNVSVFPGVASTGRYFNNGGGSTEVYKDTFWFLIPEAMTYKEIVYGPDDQHMPIPEVGETLALPEPEADFETKFPASLKMTEAITVQMGQPVILIDAKDHLILSIPLAVTNNDATANQELHALIQTVDSTGMQWGLLGANAVLGPSQTENVTASTVSVPITIDQLPDAFYLAMDGFDQPYFFKVDAKQLAASKQ